jgi:hypothetical protein
MRLERVDVRGTVDRHLLAIEASHFIESALKLDSVCAEVLDEVRASGWEPGLTEDESRAIVEVGFRRKTDRHPRARAAKHAAAVVLPARLRGLAPIHRQGTLPAPRPLDDRSPGGPHHPLRLAGRSPSDADQTLELVGPRRLRRDGARGVPQKTSGSTCRSTSRFSPRRTRLRASCRR